MSFFSSKKAPSGSASMSNAVTAPPPTSTLPPGAMGSAGPSETLPPGAAPGAAFKGTKLQLLDVLSTVKTRVQDKLGIVDFPMPQFILIGTQSVGKSRLVESIAGETFNFVSGTLGSRRPTVLEFRNVAACEQSKWYVLDKETNKWNEHAMPSVMDIVSKAHNELGHSVSAEAIQIRVESSKCADLQIVDLPGYRGFAHDEKGKQLADAILKLNTSFLVDPRNQIICVEEAGDAANMSSLRQVCEFDPQFKRTILVRTKLDKYYGDLTADNVNKWLEGFGDLPKTLQKFALTLPHWMEGSPPPASLSALRDKVDQEDISRLSALGTSKMYLDTVGWSNLAKFVEKQTEKMFIEAIGPVLQKLRDLESAMKQKQEDLKEELDTSDPTQMLATVRSCGISFANCLTYIMEGFIRSDINRMTLDGELHEFHRYQQSLGTYDEKFLLPTEDFNILDDYIEYLRSHIRVPAFEVGINGGAQFRRLMFEVETFLRFSEIGIEIKKRDVLQSLGISLGSITWREVVVKLLNHDAHLPLQRRVQYVGERIMWFFMMQKEPIVEWMLSLEGSPDEKLYSVLYSRNAKLLEQNQTIRKLVFDTYDAVCRRQLTQFLELFKSTLHATFANPWVFLKKTSARLEEADLGAECQLPSLDDTKQRIPQEIQSRTGIERTVTKWIYDIPQELHKLDEATDQVQLLVLKVYSHIRSQVCDQVELFAQSFFKMPLMRHLESDMMKIELSEVDREGYRVRREKLVTDESTNEHALGEVKDCIRILSDFVLANMSP